MTEEFFAQQQNIKAFEEIVTGEDAAIDIFRAALLIAAIEYPQSSLTHSHSHLDALAFRVRELLAASQPDEVILPTPGASLTVIDAINQVLFEEEKFHGNKSDYYNPDNSFINKVLESRTGIPISLSLIYMEVGKRVGLSVEGVGLPFHFVVRCLLPTEPAETIYIDPFEGGLLMSEEDCRDKIKRFSHGKITHVPQHYFEPIRPKQMLVRMLGNLKNIYIHKEDYTKSLLVSDYILVLYPNAARELRDRGVICLQLKRYSKALRDLTAYLKLEPQAEDRNEIQKHIQTLRQIIAMMN